MTAAGEWEDSGCCLLPSNVTGQGIDFRGSRLSSSGPLTSTPGAAPPRHPLLLPSLHLLSSARAVPLDTFLAAEDRPRTFASGRPVSGLGDRRGALGVAPAAPAYELWPSAVSCSESVLAQTWDHRRSPPGALPLPSSFQTSVCLVFSRVTIRRRHFAQHLLALEQ